MERYGEAIAADLAFAGWDVLDLYDSGRWAFTLNLIDHLPRTSAYVQALAEDEELAADLPPEVGAGRRAMPHREWSPEAEIMAGVYNRVGDLIDVLAQVNDNRPPRLERWPGPVSAWQKVQSERSRAAVDEMAAKLFPEEARR